MTITLTPGVERIVRQKRNSGRSPASAYIVRESPRLLSAQEAFYALKADITAGMEQAEEGRLRTFGADNVLRRVRRILHVA